MMQGINWFLRRAISFATITLHVHQYIESAHDDDDDGDESSPSGTTATVRNDADQEPQAEKGEDLAKGKEEMKKKEGTGTETETGVTHIDIKQTATGGIKGTTELRTLDWQVREHTDHIFGTLESRCRWVDIDADETAVPDEFLKQGWLKGRWMVEGRMDGCWCKGG